MDHSDPWGLHKILSSHENYIRFHSLIRAKYIFFQSRKVSRIKINTLSTFSCAWHPVTSSEISSLRSGSLFNFAIHGCEYHHLQVKNWSNISTTTHLIYYITNLSEITYLFQPKTSLIRQDNLKHLSYNPIGW